MTLSHSSGFRNAGKVYTAVCISLAASLVFWPLLSSILLIFLSAYWIVFVKKKILLSSTRSRLVLLFSSLYLPVIIGTFYSTDINEAFAQLRIKVPLLAIPVIFGFSNRHSSVDAIGETDSFESFNFLLIVKFFLQASNASIHKATCRFPSYKHR